MADERNAQFDHDLTKMSDDEVRRQFDPSIQPVPFLRTLAVTELAKRRQKRWDALTGKNRSAGKVAVWVTMLGAIVAAVVAWFWWGTYVN